MQSGLIFLRGTTSMLLNEIVSVFVNLRGGEDNTLKEVKFINLSLSALGKCSNALTGNNTHVSFRDSKLTKLLCDSFE